MPVHMGEFGWNTPSLKAAAAQALKAAGPVLRDELPQALRGLHEHPGEYVDHPQLGVLARAILDAPVFHERAHPAPWRQWGEDLGDATYRQMRNAARLPVAVAGALMPDAHPGYGLPIGGVLATDDSVVPYAVGVDIACRMRLSVFDTPVERLTADVPGLSGIVERHTAFGLGATPADRADHAVMDDPTWRELTVTRGLYDKAGAQLGSSGSGNHFVEFGLITFPQDAVGVPAGRYVALLSHSGSRGAGAGVAGHYTKLAMARHPELPDDLQHLAWLSLDDDAGREYWAAMNLMGRYAAANHEIIHARITAALGAHVLLGVENHHNFAWRETHGGREVIVHRKGATPAGEGVLGIIPGSMAAPGYLVSGKGSPASLHSASHGAGRVMSRTEARRNITWHDMRRRVEAADVTLLSAGVDESPGVYKDIAQVMRAQADLVDTLARFDPRIVKMADAGEAPED